MRRATKTWAALAFSILATGLAVADVPTAGPISPEAAAQRRELLDRAVLYCRTIGQAEDGSFSREKGPAITAIVAAGLLRNGVPATDPVVAKSLDYLQGFVQSDGGVYQTGSTHRNYETCISIIAFSAANTDGRYDALLAGADSLVRKLQWDEEEGHGVDSLYYGGAGYGGSERPDMSNTSFLVDALVAGGAEEDDPNLQKALHFISNCQNLESEHNQTPFGALIDDGGFYYTCAAGGQSKSEPAPGDPPGALRSYASMSYAGLKSMIYAGVEADDPRVRAVREWIAQHYALDENPGVGLQGLYYYYNTFAKALDAVGEPELVDASGRSHDWRADLLAALAERQGDDGSWTNEQPRWLESDPNLSTGYVLLALAHLAGE